MKRREQKETRLERWLSELADRLQAGGISVKLAYDDRQGGDLLALVVTASPGSPGSHWELQADRRARLLVLRLFASSAEVANRVASTLDGAHRAVPRRHNARRKFIHRIERMAAHLGGSFTTRKGQYPRAALERLPPGQRVAAKRLVGIERRWRGQPADGEEPAGSELDPRDARRYATRWGALVAARGGRRAAVFEALGGRFTLGGVALAAGAGTVAASVAASLADGDPREPSRLEQAADGVDVIDLGDVAFDAGELVTESAESCWPDCDIIDLPDCGGCDVPDCSF